MPSKNVYTTREEWLNAAVLALNLMVAEKTLLRPSGSVLVSAGWPRNDRRGKVIGQCFSGAGSNGAHHVFISPMLSTATEVLPVLLHELVHAADGCKNNHKGPFRAAWRSLGFEGKATESSPGKELKAALREVAGTLGAYPHKKLNPVSAGSKPQVSRQLKVECPACGCIARMSRKAIDDVGLPTCACQRLIAAGKAKPMVEVP